MANKRVTETLLPADFVDGQVLYGADINKIITILREAVNQNKLDMDKILTGYTSPNVVYSYEALSTITSPANGDYGFVYNPEVSGDGIKVYRYVLDSNNWVYQNDLTLLELYNVIVELKESSAIGGIKLYNTITQAEEEINVNDTLALIVSETITI